MKNLTLSLGRFAVVVASALSLGACSRSEYAFQPHSASYLGSTPVARQRAVAAPAPAIATTGSAVVTAPAAAHSVAPEALVAAQPAPVAVAPAAPVAAAPLAATPAPVATPATAPKLNLVQRLALRKIAKKLDKLTSQTPQFKKHDATASTAAISGNLRTGIILLIVGVLVGLLNGLIGTIIAIIGLIFIVLWLLDEL